MKKKRLLIGREPEQAEELVHLLEENISHSWSISSLPLILTRPLATRNIQIKRYDTLLFTSATAVRYYLSSGGTLEEKQILTLGKKTAQALSPISPHFISSFPNALEMAKELIAHQHLYLRGHSILQPMSTRASRFLQEQLTPFVSSYQAIHYYETLPNLSLDQGILNQTDAVIFYSPSAIDSWETMTEHRPYAITLGATSTRRLLKTGLWTHHLESPSPEYQDILQTIKQINKTYTYVS